jgi:hypothetical protein
MFFSLSVSRQQLDVAAFGNCDMPADLAAFPEANVLRFYLRSGNVQFCERPPNDFQLADATIPDGQRVKFGECLPIYRKRDVLKRFEQVGRGDRVPDA